MKIIFSIQIKVKVSNKRQVGIILSDGSSQTCSKYPKKEVGNISVLEMYWKKCCNGFGFYCDAKHSDILQGSSHVRCYLFLTN